ncbi:hypothetical protein L21SP2_1428 [Salinispira pacifica]|uniref:Uncharacterized protein n=1 Tax=Salinispira pacifica TaxID=1307761 RepID=V5WGR8_9SPIO|nr:hypothetical protein L21SP2_1428 [Salinispira pacifica]
MDMDAIIFILMYSYTLFPFIDFVKGMYHYEPHESAEHHV